MQYSSPLTNKIASSVSSNPLAGFANLQQFSAYNDVRLTSLAGFSISTR